jgi:hypothetical protein
VRRHYWGDFLARREVCMPEGSEDETAWHPRCCEVPMWLVEVPRAGAGPRCYYIFECKVCDGRVMEPADNEAA